MADINGLIFRATKAAGLLTIDGWTSRTRARMLRRLTALFGYTSAAAAGSRRENNIARSILCARRVIIIISIIINYRVIM